jgi:hypothetical protein
MSLPIIVRCNGPGVQINALRRDTVDLNALAWLEDYLQTWAGTILVV